MQSSTLLFKYEAVQHPCTGTCHLPTSCPSLSPPLTSFLARNRPLPVFTTIVSVTAWPQVCPRLQPGQLDVGGVGPGGGEEAGGRLCPDIPGQRDGQVSVRGGWGRGDSDTCPLPSPLSMRFLCGVAMLGDSEVAKCIRGGEGGGGQLTFHQTLNSTPVCVCVVVLQGE